MTGSKLNAVLHQPKRRKHSEDRIEPKIEITLYENEEVLDIISSKSVETITADIQLEAIPLERRPIDQSVLIQILNLPLYQDQKTQWQQLSDDQKDKFRLNLHANLNVKNLETHPFKLLLKDHSTLNTTLEQWTTALNLSLDQYDALLDVYSEKGIEGVEHLFTVWDRLNKENTVAFKELHQTLLKKIPTYMPFIEDPSFINTIEKISLLGKEKYAWWRALIKNHAETQQNYEDLAFLYQSFVRNAEQIETMSLHFLPINSIKDKNSLPKTLEKILSLLKKCSPKDREKQFSCIHQIVTDELQQFYFIVPEMHEGGGQLLESLKTQKDPQHIKHIVYRYLATKKYHLPLKDYEKYLDDILKNPPFPAESQCKMAYLLAKTTSAENAEGFDADSISQEWESFKERFETLSSIDRMKANRSGLEKRAFELGLSVQGPEALRLAGITPIVNMNPVPPISFLNKLLKTSEYKFLDPAMTLKQLQGVQNAMMNKIEEAAGLYTKYPDEMMHAVRLIKTATVAPNKEGKYEPEPRDINLLEQFIQHSETLTNKKYNTHDNQELNPEKTLLPLLTIFHLEYQDTPQIIECIIAYNNRVRHSENPRVPSLLPYALSLLKLIQNREEPTPLTLETLNQIQDELILKINVKEINSRQDIRQWMNQKYGAYFIANQLLDIKDEVNVDEELSAAGIQTPSTREAISTILSYFNELEEEKEALKNLTETLIDFDKKLPPAKATEFYHYCMGALKTNELLSRNKNSIPPSYLEQFKSLVTTLTEAKSIDAFQQFMDMTQERRLQENSDSLDSLTKCNYLLGTLYPALMKQGISSKDAFQFGCELTLNTPKEILTITIENVNIESLQLSKKQQLQNLKDQITQLDFRITYENYVLELIDIKNSFNAIVSPFLQYDDLFQDYRQIIDLIEQMIDDEDKFYKELEKKNIFLKAYSIFLYAGKYSEKKATLDDAGLDTLTKPEGSLLRDLSEAIRRQGTYFQDIAIDLYQKKQKLLKKYPSLSTRATDFINKTLQISPEKPHQNHLIFTTLMDQLIALDDSNLVLSLMYHYNGALPEKSAQDLADILNQDELQKLPQHTQKKVIQALVSQLNNGVDTPKETIRSFIQFIHDQQNDTVLKYLEQYYQHAPFPPLSTFIDWFSQPYSEQEINIKYAHFDKNPCELDGHNGREEGNVFDRDKARLNLEKMPEVNPDIFTEEYLTLVEATAKAAKVLSTEELLAAVKAFKEKETSHHISLVMYTIELLHRCKGRPPEFVGDQQIPGRSFELNTTQILAILSMLETGQKVTAEIGTGEGKSRIMMILNACQFLKGNTIDFITSNLALAERDYIEALPFYHSLGAKVNFITANSSIDDYQIGGINVSDPANLRLFRNKAIYQKQQHRVLDPDLKKRALLLDEADVTYFDVSNKQYNYATHTPQENIDLLPLYPILMDFFAEEETEQLYREDKTLCNKRLLARIEEKMPKLFARIKNVSRPQLEKWQDTAYIARHLRYNIDYTIVSDAEIPTALGHKKVSAAMCLIGSRINEHAQFSDGVHQCLHAELNRLTKNQDLKPNTGDLYLDQALSTCQKLKRSFQITPERQINYKSTSDNMLKEYKDGYLYAVTGTLGVSIEKAEARTNFGSKFLTIPRHMGLYRIDKPTLVAENEERQLEALVQHILASRDNQQPILMMCKNDNESQEFYDKLMARLQPYLKDGLPNLTRIDAANYRDGNTPIAQFIKEKAGLPGQVIITTDILGRGIEYPLRNEARRKGLKVLLTYLPKTQRDYGQNIGRGGRYGQVGESQMVLNSRTLKQNFGIDYLNHNYYINPEAFITRLQLFATYTKTLHRLFSKSFDDLLTEYTHQFNQLPNNETTTALWSEFLKQQQLDRDKTEKNIMYQLEQTTPNLGIIEQQLCEHQTFMQEQWTQLCDQLSLKDDAPQRQLFVIEKPILLNQWINTLKELQKTNQAMTVVTETINIKVSSSYDISQAGHMAILQNTSNWIRWRDNFRAWRHNEGLLFPNFHAWRNGELSTKNYLSQLPIFNLILKPEDESREVKTTIPTTYAAMMKIIPPNQMQETARTESKKLDSKSQKIDTGVTKTQESTLDDATNSAENEHSASPFKKQ